MIIVGYVKEVQVPVVAAGRTVLDVRLVVDDAGLVDLAHQAKREGWQNWDLIQKGQDSAT